jgi:hypothetical protein
VFLVAGFLNCLLVVFDLDPGRCSLLGIFVDDEGPHIFHTRAGRDNLSSFTFAFVIVGSENLLQETPILYKLTINSTFVTAIKVE